MAKTLWIISILWMTSNSVLGQAVLVKDINTNPASIESATPLFIKSGDLAFFPLADEKGRELWVTDGTKSGTNRVIDLNPGSGDGLISSQMDGIVFNGKLFFAGNNGSSGTELWCSDGTVDGTRLVKDIVSGSASSNPYGFASVAGKLFFIAYDGSSKYQLWRSDGTAANTTIVLEFDPETSIFNIVGGTSKAFFFSFVYATGLLTGSLWKLDATSEAVEKVKDIPYVEGTAIPSFLTVINDVAFYGANDGGTGDKLWRSDGSLTGTFPIENKYCFSLMNFNGKLLYAADVGFYSTNGQPFNSQLLFPSYVYGGLALNNNFYAMGSNSIIKTDGTVAGTTKVADLGPVLMYGIYQTANNKLITAYNPLATGFETQELGSFDLVTETISLIKDINPGEPGSFPRSFIELKNKVLFLADDGIHGLEVWETDGSASGTNLFVDAIPGTEDARINSLVTLNSRIYFLANDTKETYPLKLWGTDGTATGTSMIYDFSNAFYIGRLASDLYYFDDWKLWKTNGLIGGTQSIWDLSSETFSYSLTSKSFIVGNKLFYPFGSFSGSLLTGTEWWVTDGTVSGTKLVKDINPGIESGAQSTAGIDFNSSFLFAADNGVSGNELWISNGEESGTLQLKDINSGFLDSNPSSFTLLNDKAFFAATTLINGRELWSTNGTEAGTQLLKDIRPGTAGSAPSFLVTLGDQVYFIANDNVNPYSLWKTDGTAVGTNLVRSWSAGISMLRVVDGKLYFSADDGTHGNELWISDGTAVGTYMIDINEGPASSNPGDFFSTNGASYFTSNNQLWKTGGTKQTTIRVSELLITSALTSLNDWVYFGATSREFGNELFKIKNKAFQTITFQDFQAKDFGDPDFQLNAVSSSGLPLNVNFSEPGIAQWVNGKIKILKAGSVDVTVSSSANDDFEEAVPVTKKLVINKGSQIIIVDVVSAKTIGGSSFALNATSSSGLPISFESTSDRIAISGATVQLIKAGKANVTASQDGNENFNPATPVQFEFCVNPAKPGLTINSSNLAEPELFSSSSDNNVWYHNNKALTATGSSIKVTQPGQYKVKVIVDGCESEFSETQNVVITGIENEKSVEIYPSPTSGNITISLPPQSGTATILLLGLDGAIKAQYTTNSSICTVDISTFEKAVYLMQVNYLGVTIIKKIVKE